MKTSKAYDIDERSEEVREVLNTAPRWIITWGASIISLVIIVFLTLCQFIKYPDKISAQVTIYSSPPPVRLFARTSGYIKEIFHNEGDTVKKDEILAYILNPSNIDDVFLLETMIENLYDAKIFVKDSLQKYASQKNLQVGELQQTYAELIQAINNLLFQLNDSLIINQIKLISGQVKIKRDFAESLLKKYKLLSEQLLLEEQKFHIDSSLFKDKVISAIDFNTTKKNTLSKNYYQKMLTMIYFKTRHNK
ncbi:MAG: hypothetical protein QM763_10790 [Agriterribacter sp.]